MRRWHTGWALLRGCFAVIRAVPVLLWPGFVHAVLTFGIGALLFVSVRDAVGYGPEKLFLLFGALVATSVVGSLTAAVVVAVTTEHMNGHPIGLHEGVRLVTPHLPGLLVWSLLNATVGAALRALEERLGALGRLATWGAGALFAMATLLVVPVVLFEGGSVRQALRRSATLFRERWGEAAVSRGGIETVLAFWWIAAVVLIVGPLAVVGTVPAIVAAFLVTAAYLALNATATAVLSAALYRYATDGDGGPFGDLSCLFAERGRQYQPAYAGAHGEWDAS